MTRPRIDLVSDTATRPSAAMREAMLGAETGDEQKREDPTVELLCQKVAELLGKEAAVFLPSGTMCNLVSVLVHCDRADEVICADGDHIYNLEGAGTSALAGVSFRTIPTTNGVLDPGAVEAHLRVPGAKHPRSRVIVVEQTSNSGGGTITPLSVLRDLRILADRFALVVHVDGARLFNAAVASGVDPADYGGCVDSIWVDLSKGLGCPVGAVLAGGKDFIDAAWAWKHRLGGAMRQTGILAAAGLYALENNVTRLSDDHRNARRFADVISGDARIRLRNPVIETNIVYFDVSATGLSAITIRQRLSDQGIRIGAEDNHWMRAVTHADASRAEVIEAAHALRHVVSESGSAALV